ncbi:MAG: PAS domain S-box protein [Solirubrobacteraceae bacterium]
MGDPSAVICVADRRSGRLVAVSHAFCSLTGYHQEALVGRTPAEAGLMADDESRSKLFAWPDREVATSIHVALRCQDGTVRSVLFSVQVAGDLSVAISHVSAHDDVAGRGWADESRLAAAVESMLDAFMLASSVRDGDGEIVDFRYEYVNRAAVTMMGGGHERVGQRIGELTAGFLRSRRFEIYRRAVISGEACRTEEVISISAPDGTLFPPRLIEFSVVAQGETLAVSSRDVTELRRIQAELESSEARFRAATAAMQDLFAIFSAVRDEHHEIIDFVFDYVNDAYCTAVRMGRNTLMGARLGVVFPGFLDSPRFATYRDAILSGEPVRNRDYTGQSLWEATGLAGRLLDLVVVATGDTLVLSGRDITDRVAAERELALRGELLDLAHDAVIVRDATESRVTFWNREAEAIYGHAAAQAVGQITHELLATVFPESRAAVDAALASDGQWAGVLHHTRQDGREIVVSSRQALRRDADGRPAAIIELNSDITERVTAEVRVTELNAQLEAANRELESWSDALGRLAGGVAHELNNKLTVILGYNAGVSRKLDRADPLQGELTEVRAAAEHATALTRDLLAFARRQMLAPEPVVASQIADGLRRMLRPALGEAIELVITDRAHHARVFADLAQLQHAVLYLALNGCDAMPDGGRLTIQTSADPRPAGGQTGSPTVRISVSDTGTGIPADIRDRIFEPFFTTKEFGVGSGLGLSAALGIVEQSGGTINLESEPGHGTTFVITLPQLLPGHQPPTDQSSPSPRYGVLLVERNEEVALLIELLLSDAGHHVQYAATREHALTIMRDPPQPVDLVLADMTLASGDGGAMIRAAMGLRPQLRLIYMSADRDALPRREGMPTGDGFLIKPFTSDELRAALGTAFATPPRHDNCDAL